MISMEDPSIPQKTEKGSNDHQERIVYPAKRVARQIVLHTAIIALMIGLNTVATIVFAVYIPISNGFFNIGESMVFLTAILFGPYIGAISGGIGASLADILLGFVHYAPGTLIIKGMEALIVGYLYQKFITFKQNSQQKSFKKILELISVIGISLAIALTILFVGLIFYIGPAEISGFNYLYIFSANFTRIFWSIIAGSSFISILLIYFFVDSRISLKIIAMFSGGMFMVIGYVIYATFIIGIATAYWEMPFNLLQVCIGITIAVPISGPIRNTLKL